MLLQDFECIKFNPEVLRKELTKVVLGGVVGAIPI